MNHDDLPTFYLPDSVWDGLMARLAQSERLRALLGVKLSPVTGEFAEDLAFDRLGGDFDIWPERCRAIIEAEAA